MALVDWYFNPTNMALRPYHASTIGDTPTSFPPNTSPYWSDIVSEGITHFQQIIDVHNWLIAIHRYDLGRLVSGALNPTSSSAVYLPYFSSNRPLDLATVQAIRDSFDANFTAGNWRQDLRLINYGDILELRAKLAPDPIVFMHFNTQNQLYNDDLFLNTWTTDAPLLNARIDEVAAFCNLLLGLYKLPAFDANPHSVDRLVEPSRLASTPLHNSTFDTIGLTNTSVLTKSDYWDKYNALISGYTKAGILICLIQTADWNNNRVPGLLDFMAEVKATGTIVMPRRVVFGETFCELHYADLSEIIQIDKKRYFGDNLL